MFSLLRLLNVNVKLEGSQRFLRILVDDVEQIIPHSAAWT